ncbi:MAG: hypothetical protein IPJ30_25575 [Acidobacteria bacterium]|nr:hypothetical protein [Acidobacteriota bacterium]
MSIYDRFEPINLDEIRTYELASRPSKVTVKDFAKPLGDGDSLRGFLEGLPDILGAVRSLREVASRVRREGTGKPVIWGIGGHVVKTGLAPVIIDLMKRGYVSAIAGNGSVLVHDTEIALAGFTSEDVDASLGEGDFGAARETGEILNAAAKMAVTDGIGLGEALGRSWSGVQTRESRCIALCAAYEKQGSVHRSSDDRADIGHFTPRRRRSRSARRRTRISGFFVRSSAIWTAAGFISISVRR